MLLIKRHFTLYYDPAYLIHQQINAIRLECIENLSFSNMFATHL